MQTMYPGQPNSPQTELAQAIDDTQTTIPLLDASKLPPAPNLATIGVGEDAETVLYEGIDGNDLTGVTRGFQGTARAWVQGTKVARYFTAYDYDALRQNVADHTAATTGVHGATSAATANTIIQRDSAGRAKVAAPAAADDIARKDTIDNAINTHLADYVRQPGYAAATGSANAYSVTLNPAPSAYVDGMAIAVKINVDNTGPSTLNVNGLGAKPIKKPNGNDVAAGNLKAGSVYTLRYNGTNFILQGEGGSGNAQPSDVLSGKTFTNDQGEQVGTMPNRTGHVNAAGSSRSGTTLRLQPQPGYYPGGSGNSVQIDEPNLLPENIRQGKSIFGVSGSLVPGASIKTVQRGQTAMTSATRTVTISPVDVNKSFVKLSINSSAGNQSRHVLGKLIDATTLQLEANAQDQSTTVYWEVVEFETLKSLQKGETIVSGQISVSVTISSVDTTKAFVIFSDLDDITSHRSNYAYLYSNTTLIVGTNTGFGTAKFYWYVIEF